MIELALIQRKDGQINSTSTFNAFLGLEERGIETMFFEGDDVFKDRIESRPERLVVGGVGVVQHALGRLGVKTPAISDLPECLSEFRGRRVWQSNWTQIRSAFNESASPVFVKPLVATKACKGHIVSVFRDLIPTAGLPDAMDLLVSEVVNFVSEWRIFVMRGKIIGAFNYAGKHLIFPDRGTIESAVRIFGENAPAAYAIDFGVTDDSRTLLVEVNDGYSLGSLGLRPMIYSELLEARWLELVGHGRK